MKALPNWFRSVLKNGTKKNENEQVVSNKPNSAVKYLMAKSDISSSDHKYYEEVLKTGRISAKVYYTDVKEVVQQLTKLGFLNHNVPTQSNIYDYWGFHIDINVSEKSVSWGQGQKSQNFRDSSKPDFSSIKPVIELFNGQKMVVTMPAQYIRNPNPVRDKLNHDWFFTEEEARVSKKIEINPFNLPTHIDSVFEMLSYINSLKTDNKTLLGKTLSLKKDLQSLNHIEKAQKFKELMAEQLFVLEKNEFVIKERQSKMQLFETKCFQIINEWAEEEQIVEQVNSINSQINTLIQNSLAIDLKLSVMDSSLYGVEYVQLLQELVIETNKLDSEDKLRKIHFDVLNNKEQVMLLLDEFRDSEQTNFLTTPTPPQLQYQQ